MDAAERWGCFVCMDQLWNNKIVLGFEPIQFFLGWAFPAFEALRIWLSVMDLMKCTQLSILLFLGCTFCISITHSRTTHWYFVPTCGCCNSRVGFLLLSTALEWWADPRFLGRYPSPNQSIKNAEPPATPRGENEEFCKCLDVNWLPQSCGAEPFPLSLL